jgi:SNF2 family DNA or RNA helicase
MQASCRIAVWVSLTYSNETYIQTNARLIRTGQAAETLIYRLICPGTIDDAVAEALRDKSDTQSGMLAAINALQQLNKS